jgi:large subunit ribosomal protein L22
MKAILKNYRQSPRKVRLVAKAVRGKSASQAAMILDFMPKRAADPIKKLIDSAVANARVNNGLAIEDLVVKNIEINQGVTLKRYRPRARGSAYRINKRTSHIVVTLESKKDKAAGEAAATPVVKTAKPVAKKAAVKKAPAKKAAVKKSTK